MVREYDFRFIRKDDMRNILNTLLADTAVSSEIEEFLRTAPVDNQDRVDYRGFTSICLCFIFFMQLAKSNLHFQDLC